MDTRGISKEIFKKLHLDEIVEVRKLDLFVLMESTRQYMCEIGMGDECAAKVLAAIFIQNKWGERIVDEFTEFILGVDYGEQGNSALN